MLSHFDPRSVRPTTNMGRIRQAVPVPICGIWRSPESDWEESKKFLGKLLEMTGKTQMSFPSHFLTLKQRLVSP